jgi:hypothetical protein
MDPLLTSTQARALIWLGKFTRRKFFNWRQRVRLKKGKPLKESPFSSAIPTFTEEEDMELGKEVLTSVIRHFTPFAAAYAAGQGVTISDDASPTVTLVVAGAVYLAAQGWSIVRKVMRRNKEPVQPVQPPVQ